jgi:hypothetical protein
MNQVKSSCPHPADRRQVRRFRYALDGQPVSEEFEAFRCGACDGNLKLGGRRDDTVEPGQSAIELVWSSDWLPAK